MKTSHRLTFAPLAALAAALFFQMPAKAAENQGFNGDLNNGAATVTWTKWITSQTPTATVFAFLKGIVGGDVGEGTFTGEALTRTPLGDGVLIEADYHFHGSKHDFTARLLIVQTNVRVNGVITDQLGVVAGIVTEGWLKGNEVAGQYSRKPFANPDGTSPFSFSGTLQIKKGSKNND
jgi:hypothetical protein